MADHRTPGPSPRRAFLCLCVATLISPSVLPAQKTSEPPDWRAWQFLIGEWVGAGGGGAGEGTGNFSFTTDLQSTILVRRNHSDFPASQEHPAYSHDDLMVIYREGATQTRAAYFDNEGHVIRYSTEFSSDSNSVVFISDPAPLTPRFRLTYEKKGGDMVTIRFEFAPPGKPDSFTRYIDAVARRK